MRIMRQFTTISTLSENSQADNRFPLSCFYWVVYATSFSPSNYCRSSTNYFQISFFQSDMRTIRIQSTKGIKLRNLSYGHTSHHTKISSIYISNVVVQLLENQPAMSYIFLIPNLHTKNPNGGRLSQIFSQILEIWFLRTNITNSPYKDF